MPLRISGCLQDGDDAGGSAAAEVLGEGTAGAGNLALSGVAEHLLGEVTDLRDAGGSDGVAFGLESA
jgi:hypothetical protein